MTLNICEAEVGYGAIAHLTSVAEMVQLRRCNIIKAERSKASVNANSAQKVKGVKPAFPDPGDIRRDLLIPTQLQLT